MIIRFAAVAALGIGVAVGFAAPASADLDEGSYTSTVGENTMGYTVGAVTQLTFASCGEGCMTQRFPSGKEFEFHLEGNTWVNHFGDGCTDTIDNDSLLLYETCPEGTANIQLVKN